MQTIEQFTKQIDDLRKNKKDKSEKEKLIDLLELKLSPSDFDEAIYLFDWCLNDENYLSFEEGREEGKNQTKEEYREALEIAQHLCNEWDSETEELDDHVQELREELKRIEF